MTSFDLVPSDYRLHIAQSSLLKKLGLLLLAILGCGTLVYLLLGWTTQQAQAQRAGLEAQRTSQLKQVALYQRLRAQVKTLEADASHLANLARSPTVPQLFSSVEQAAAKEVVWLRHWRFEQPQDGTMLPRGQLHGQAADHGALASFIQHLLGADAIAAVDISAAVLQPQATNNPSDSSRVNFVLQISLRAPAMPGLPS